MNKHPRPYAQADRKEVNERKMANNILEEQLCLMVKS